MDATQSTVVENDQKGSWFWEVSVRSCREFARYLPDTSSCVGTNRRRPVSHGSGEINARNLETASDESERPKSVQEIAGDFLGCNNKPLSLRRMAFAHASQLTYAVTCESMVIALPYINRHLGGDMQDCALLQSGMAGMQVVGGVAIGSLQDRIGTKYALLLSHISVMANASIMSVARSWHPLVLCTIPAFTQHGFQSASQIAVRCSEPEVRAVSLGRVAMSYGLGWFAGAMILSKVMEKMAPQNMLKLMLGSELVVISAVALMYPNEDDLVSLDRSDSDSMFKRISQILQIPGVLPYLACKVAICVSGGAIYCMVSQFALDPFRFSPAATSRLVALISTLQLFSQGVLSPMMTKTPPLWKLQVGSLVFLGLPLLALSVLPTSGFNFAVAVVPISIGWNVLNNIINTTLSCIVPESLSGAMLGLSLAPMTATFVISPILSAMLFKAYGFKCVAEVAGATLVGTQLLANGLEHITKKPQRDDEE